MRDLDSSPVPSLEPRVKRLALALLLTQTGCLAYLSKAAYFQAELLAGREPLDDVLTSGDLTPTQADRLRLVPDIKAFGESIGLADTDNYDTVNLGWQRGIYTVTAAPPLSFEAKTWWFPIVGGVPYIGFFRDSDARKRADRVAAKGYETHIGRASAYSTLGFFRDPVLPGMLDWDEARLAETVLHELAHATLANEGMGQPSSRRPRTHTALREGKTHRNSLPPNSGYNHRHPVHRTDTSLPKHWYKNHPQEAIPRLTHTPPNNRVLQRTGYHSKGLSCSKRSG